MGNKAWFCSSAMLVICMATTAHAQTVASGAVESAEIIVTATKRSERLLDVPLAVSAIGGYVLHNAQVKWYRHAAAAGAVVHAESTTARFVKP